MDSSIPNNLLTQPAPVDDLVDKARLASFSDNVISIAITLLVLDVQLPPGFKDLTFHGILKALAPNLQGFVLSFAIVGVYGVGHHMMLQSIRVAPRALLWANNLFLMFVTLVPASAALLGGHPSRPAIAVLYGLNIALVGVALLIVWTIAVRHHRALGMDLAPATVKRTYRRVGSGVVISVIGVMLAAVSPWISYAVYWIAPLTFVVLQLLPIEKNAAATS